MLLINKVLSNTRRLRIAQLSQEKKIFDWITSSFQTVLNVLRCVNAQDFVNKLTTNIEFKSEKFEVNRIINCPQLGKFESYHDLPFDLDETLFQEHFVKKYLRRYVRFIKLYPIQNHLYSCVGYQRMILVFVKKTSTSFSKRLRNQFEQKSLSGFDSRKHKGIPNYHRNNIQCYQLKDYEKEFAKSNDWQLNHIDWDRLLKEITLI